MDNIPLKVQEADSIALHVEEGRQKPTQTKNAVPQYEPQTITPDEGYLLEAVDIEAIPEPTERIEITENGEYDVKRIGTAEVNVPQGVFPSGELSITQNGAYDVTQYVTANVNTEPRKGIIFDFDETGHVTRGTIVGFSDDIPVNYCRGMSETNNLFSGIEIVVSKTVSVLPNGFCSQCGGVKKLIVKGDITMPDGFIIANSNWFESAIFEGNVDTISGLAFYAVPNTMLYDFSSASRIPNLVNISGLSHKSGCVIRVPQNLLSEWQTANVWRDLTDVVWEGI